MGQPHLHFELRIQPRRPFRFLRRRGLQVAVPRRSDAALSANEFSFLEGGVGWARSLLADLIGHWEKRNREALANYDPRNIDQELLAELSRRYGGKVIEGREYVKGREIVRIREGDPSDDFANCAITRKEDFRELFLKPFFFGCEADDPVTASAFDAVRNPLSARINALYGSDIGHFDVPDMSEVTAEAYEPVERGSDDRG